MTTYKLDIKTTHEKAEFFRKYANLNGAESAKLGEHYDNIYTVEGTFENGYVAEIQFVIADYDNPNWTMGTLYDTHGNNIAECYGEDGDIFGEWYFYPKGNLINDEFIVNVSEVD